VSVAVLNWVSGNGRYGNQHSEISMTYAIIGSGLVGATLARFFAAKNIPVLIANSRGPESLGKLAAELGESIKAVTVEDAVEADVILIAVGALAFKDVGAVLQDWSGKIVIDVTNGFMLPSQVRQAEYQGRLTSEVNAEHVPGAKLVKAFNQLPFKVLASPLPDPIGRRVVFVSSDHEDASATVAALAESLGFAAIEVGKIAEGGRLIQARAPLVFQNLIKYPL
jgi:8-hydroxy-5-deazaflavin:NADPH oxidoreductase